MRGEVADDFIGIDVYHHGADWHGDRVVLATLAVTLLAHAVLAALGLELLLVAEVDEGIEVLVGLDPDIATIAAITAVRAAERDELLATEANAAVAAVACGDRDFCFVDEFHGRGARYLLPSSPRRRGSSDFKRLCCKDQKRPPDDGARRR